MSATKSALDKLIESTSNHWPTLTPKARAELVQLRADLQAAHERIAWLTSDIGESGLAAINRLIAACERGDIAQHAAPDLSIARDEILRQARQLDEARKAMTDSIGFDIARPGCECPICAWLAANPATHQDDERIDKQLDNSGWEADEVAEV